VGIHARKIIATLCPPATACRALPHVRNIFLPCSDRLPVFMFGSIARGLFSDHWPDSRFGSHARSAREAVPVIPKRLAWRFQCSDADPRSAGRSRTRRVRRAPCPAVYLPSQFFLPRRSHPDFSPVGPRLSRCIDSYSPPFKPRPLPWQRSLHPAGRTLPACQNSSVIMGLSKHPGSHPPGGCAFVTAASGDGRSAFLFTSGSGSAW
jgi:hypothetical protein